MIDEFKRALCKRADLTYTKDLLYAEAERTCGNRCDEIERNFKAAKFISWALREDHDSEQYQLARSFLEKYSRDTGEPIIEEQSQDGIEALQFMALPEVKTDGAEDANAGKGSGANES